MFQVQFGFSERSAMGDRVRTAGRVMNVPRGLPQYRLLLVWSDYDDAQQTKKTDEKTKPTGSRW